MTLSYAGVTLGAIDKDLRDWCEKYLRLSDSIEFPSLIQSRDLLDFPGAAVIDARPVRVGLLRWPKFASRFSVCNLIVTDNQLAQITVATASGLYSAYPLKLDWHDANHNPIYSISPPMYRLPPRPIAQPGGGSNGFWMLTLVDDRFFWWRRPNAALTVTEGTTTWLQLYAAIATELGITLTADTPNAAYLKPPGVFAVTYERLPLILDAVAYSCGQRITANLDGTYRARNLSNGVADTAANSALPRKVLVAGGTFAILPTNAYAGTVLVTFPGFEGTSPNGTTYTVSVAVPNGRTADTKTFHSSAVARYTATVLQNGAELLLLATQIAADYATANTPLVDACFAGILPWVPDVLSESIEWQYLPEGILTRVRWGTHDDNLDFVEDLLQSGGTTPFSYVEIIRINNGAITINNGVFTLIATTVNILSQTVFNFGITTSVSVFPPGILSKPTQTVTGAPTWTPAANTYPLLWGAYDNIEWEWDGTDWCSFFNVARTQSSDSDVVAITTDRLIAFYTLTAARVVTLPAANSLPAGFALRILDESGSASVTVTISVARAGADTINNAAANLVVVNSAFGCGTATTDGVNNWTVCQPPTVAASLTTYSATNTSYSITGTYANVTGLSVTVAAGTYQIVVDGGYQWNPSAGAQTITVRLYDGTAAIGNTDPTIIDSVDMTPLGGTQYGTFSVRSTYTAAGAITITLQAKVSAAGLTPAIINSNMFVIKTG